jgi:chemotaxis protein MotA
MKFLVGVVIVFACVLGGFVMSGGQLLALWHPNELIVIGGAALGAFVISNPIKIIKKVFKDIGSLFKGPKFDKHLYMDGLGLMYDLLNKARKDGMISIEGHIEDPHASDIFGKYPKLLAQHHAIEFICDYFRLMLNGSLNAFELENLMDVELDTHHEEAGTPISAITRVADALPGFGIVAAVLGIVITMMSLAEGPEVIGHKVAAALVGTFLGILLAYGFVAPISAFLDHIAKDEAQFIKCLKTCLVASLQGYAPQIAVEFGRKAIFTSERPGFRELEEYIKGNKQ